MTTPATTHTREIRCPMDGELLDEHTNDQLVTCDEAATTYYEIFDTPKTRVPRIHDSWHYQLPERYQD